MLHKLKYVLFAGILLCIFLPLAQSFTQLVPESKLNGSFTPKEDVVFWRATWFSGEFQTKKEAFLNENFGLRNRVVRLYNQVRYNLFKKSDTRGVVVGKSNYLYESWYIRAAMGLDYMGDESLKLKAKKLGKIRNSLQEMDKDLIVVLAPGKGTYFPDNYPSNWADSTRTKTNYQQFKEQLAIRDIDVLDVQEWFSSAKDTSRYPLFPKTGIHWSKYGEYLVMDSLIRFVEERRGISMTNLVLDSLSISETMWDTDDDIEKGMNLIFDIPDFEMAYPKFRFVVDSSTVHPNVLTVADSYFWGMYNSGLSLYAYDNSEFWYYFKDVYPSRENHEQVSDLFLMQEIEELDAIVLMCTEINIYSFDFIETLYDGFYSPEQKEIERVRRIAYFEKLIANTPDWYAKIVTQAEEQQISIENALRNNAEYMVWQESME